jgi:hypothetical protein
MPVMRIPLLIILLAASGCTPQPRPPIHAMLPTVTGDIHDFDRFAGAWSFVNRRLKARGVGSTEWDTFPATSCTLPHLDGDANVDEVYFPTKDWSGLTLRTFDRAAKQWSIYWVNSREGVMYPPVVGGFTGDTGDFYGTDTDGGRPVLARFHWIVHDRDHLTWAQSFSYDRGATWEINWTNDLTRVDEATACDHGRPKRS